MTPQHSVWVTSLQHWMDWEPETIKRVGCEAALTPKDFYDLQAQHLGHLPLAWDGLGAGDYKKNLAAKQP